MADNRRDTRNRGSGGSSNTTTPQSQKVSKKSENNEESDLDILTPRDQQIVRLFMSKELKQMLGEVVAEKLEAWDKKCSEKYTKSEETRLEREKQLKDLINTKVAIEKYDEDHKEMTKRIDEEEKKTRKQEERIRQLEEKNKTLGEKNKTLTNLLHSVLMRLTALEKAPPPETEEGKREGIYGDTPDMEEALTKMFEEHKQIKKDTATALSVANNVEQHERRWAVRVNGFEAPSSRFEDPAVSKKKVVKMLNEKLGLKITKGMIDTAHRIGLVNNGKQSILCRFFARDVVDMIIDKRTKLKETGHAILEDATKKNMELLQELRDSKLCTQHWFSRGKVWGVTYNGQKVSFNVNIPVN